MEVLDKNYLFSCDRCQATGFVRMRRCMQCRGMAFGRMLRGRWLYWGFSLEPLHLALENARHTFNKVRYITFLLLGITFFIWGAYGIYKIGIGMGAPPLGAGGALTAILENSSSVFFWLGIMCFSYIKYRSIREREHKGMVEHYDYHNTSARAQADSVPTWEYIFKMGSKRRFDIAEAFTPEALQAVADAYRFAVKYNFGQVLPLHIIYTLLSYNRISNIFVRLGIPAASIKDPLLLALKGELSPKNNRATPQVSEEFQKLLIEAYEEAYSAHQQYVSVTELLAVAVRHSNQAQEILFDLNVDKQKLANVIEWARIRERLHRQHVKFRSAARHRSTKGMDRAMTAVATPYLNQFSEDVTLLAQFGHTHTCVAREHEIDELFRVVEGGQESVLLVGDFGVGKKSIVEGLAERMVEDDVPDRLKDKRLVRLSTAALLAGTTPAGAVERLMSIMNEVARAGNIILFIHNIHELMGVSAGDSDSLDVGGALADYLSGGRFLTIATTTTEAYAQHITNSKLSSIFSKVEVREMNENQAIQVLESRVGYVEYKHKVFFAYQAIEKAVKLSKQYIHDVVLPGSALEVMTEAASYVHNNKGLHALVSSEDVAEVIAEKTKIPVTSVSSDETAKLLHLEEALHKRVVGQDEAVELVANALRRARAEIRSAGRPIANFLFLGPTGVGKTELAKTIAEVYFGGENRMIRLDMSEYQDTASIYRLIGQPGQKGSGVLTEAIRRNPFALLLLDEIEKADKDILNLFLQVMDDGRLTDSTGRVVDFTNVIIIATSNAGTTYVQEQLNQGLSTDVIKDRLLHGALQEYFKPEFLNRFDGIVLFKPIGREDIKKIAALMLGHVAKDLEAKGIVLQFGDPALEFLAQVGFDPEFGARPMRRALQERVENKLAELLLAGKLERRDVVTIGEGGEMSVTSK